MSIRSGDSRSKSKVVTNGAALLTFLLSQTLGAFQNYCTVCTQIITLASWHAAKVISAHMLNFECALASLVKIVRVKI